MPGCRIGKMFLLLAALLTGFASVGVELLPNSNSDARLHAGSVAHSEHENDVGQLGGHEGCTYCQIAQASDLFGRLGNVTIHRRILPPNVGVQAASLCLPARMAPCQPRAPPRLITAQS